MGEAPRRAAVVQRDTKETQIEVVLDIDGGQIELPDSAKANGERSNKHAFQSSESQYIDIDTGIGFLDHMLHAWSKHAGWSLYLRTRGDLHSASSPTEQRRAFASGHDAGTIQWADHLNK